MANTAKVEVLQGALYEAMQDNGSNERLFGQEDLLDLDIIPNRTVDLLVLVITALTNQQLLVAVNTHVGLKWRWRDRDLAKQYLSLPNAETRQVYQCIDEAGVEGIWIRAIMNKLKMHETVVKACLKILETKGYIRSLVHVEAKTKKMYIRADLQPSERATGGPWYSEGEMDTAFITHMEGLVYEFIKTKSTYRSVHGAGAKMPKKGVAQADGARKRPAAEMLADDKATTTTTLNSASRPPAQRPGQPLLGRALKKTQTALLPMPAGFNRYPTVTDIARLIHEKKVTNNVTLSETDVQQLVDVLIFDGLVEEIRVGPRIGYRTTRIPRNDPDMLPDAIKAGAATMAEGSDMMLGVEPRRNGLTGVPCGRCPVFDICEEGALVSPRNCPYFRKWLDITEEEEREYGIAF